MHLSAHYALQSLTLTAVRGIQKVVAFGITPTSPPVCRRLLCPFALWSALPTALVGRYLHDYYEHSVTMALAGCRSSRIPSSFDVRA